MEEKFYANGIDYKFIREDDNWISIYKWDKLNFKWIPLIQAKNIEKAKNYCVLREELNIPVKKI